MGLGNRKWLLSRMELWNTQLQYHRNNQEELQLPETIVVWRDEDKDEE